MTLAAFAVGMVGLVGAPSALADTSQSSNWAGYAVHHSGINFSKVVGTWTQPSGICAPGQTGYSSIWVGIGGYNENSQALEQVGTELDCSADGHATSSAWYELVPAASQTTHLVVQPGDRIRAAVTISGRGVKLTLADQTRHHSFTKVLHASVLDTTSAEWIVEAPSICQSNSSCTTLPLADFGSAAFTGASTTTTSGHVGTISDRRWTTTKIYLVEGGRTFVGSGNGPTGASPSALTGNGNAFSVTYTGAAPVTGASTDQPKQPTASRRVSGRLVNPGRR